MTGIRIFPPEAGEGGERRRGKGGEGGKERVKYSIRNGGFSGISRYFYGEEREGKGREEERSTRVLLRIREIVEIVCNVGASHRRAKGETARIRIRKILVRVSLAAERSVGERVRKLKSAWRKGEGVTVDGEGEGGGA